MFACGKLLLLLQEDAGKAQDAATAVASLESELEQATRREEQLRASRAQCEYQLQQAGEVAQSQVIFTLHVVVAYQNSNIRVACHDRLTLFDAFIQQFLGTHTVVWSHLHHMQSVMHTCRQHA